MAIQYYMRAYNTSLSKYVDWVVNDSPDSTGTYSGYPTNQLINISVNRIVQSRVSNFLKQNQSLGGTDGYYFHVNSYDWRNATAPITPPSSLTGFAVERGLNSIVAVSTASNTAPITINTASPHGLVTGQIITIIGVTGNTNANGTWPIIVTGVSSFTLTGSVGNGAYVSGGNAFLPNDMSTLMWDEINGIWRFAFNTNGDGTTIGASQSVKVNNFLVDGYIAIGTDPADTGALRLSNNTFINWEANPTGTDIQGIGVDNFNRIKLGSLTTDQVYTPGFIVVDGYVQHDGLGNDTPSIGFIRDKNNTVIVAFRKADLSADIAALSSNGTNNVILGDAVNSGTILNTSTGSVHQFQVNTVPDFEIGNTFARFTSTVIAPSILQTTTAVSNQTGQTLTLQAQNGGAGTSTGGILQLTSGIGQGTGGHGTVIVSTGSDQKVIYYPTLNVGSNSNSILYFANLFRVDTAQLTPRIRQDDKTTGSGVGETFTVQAQNETGATSTGGALNLTSGTGTTQAGNVNIQTGGTNQIIVSPITIAPGTTTATTGSVIIRGNLEVVGTTTTVDSTVVDIIGRVIHANWADPIASPNVAVPSQVTGYSIHRGNSSGVPRDGAAVIWTEGALNSGADGYWRHVTYPGDGIGTDNFTIANSLSAVGVLATDFVSSADPNPIAGYVAASGNLRTPNNTPAVVARSILATTTLDLSSTNGTATLPVTPITVVSTTGFTTSGTLLILSSTGTQTVTYTGTNATQFTGVSGGTGTIVTGGIVAQTNNSTTFNGANGTSVPTASITVVSTTGFPPAGNLRVVTQTSNSATAAVSVQNIAYTSTDATHFLGCTGGTGFLYVGDAITSTPSPGISDLVLLGSDFGNHILHGAPTNNTGHIFNTPSTFFYDFQVNSVTQVKLGQADIDASGFSETIAIGPTVSNPRLLQTTLPNTGATNGFNLGVFAQAGQQQTGVTANNNGGQLLLASGAQGTGGSGAAGIDGYVELRTGFTSKVRVFPTLALSAADNNSILYFENLFRVDTAQVTPRFRQDDKITNGGTGETYTIQAQNETGTTSTGGALTLTSGTGTTAHGNVNIQTGGGTRVLVTTSFTTFNDSTAVEAYRITPASAGTTTLQAASTVTALTYNQADRTTVSGTGATTTLQAQNEIGTTSIGGALVLVAGSGTSTGGAASLTAGSSTVTGGLVTVAGGAGTTTGGNAIVTSGTGVTPGNVQLQTGAVDRVIVHPAFTEFRDTAEALRITPVSAGTTQITFASTDTAAQINQTTTGSATGATMTVQAQNAATTGGDLNLTSGTGGTTNGTVNLQVGGSTNASVTDSKFVMAKGWRRHVTAVSTTYQILISDEFIAADTSTAYTVTLPASPTTGDSYTVKDATGGAGTNILTISGNGVNIDGSASMVLNQAYASVALTYTGSQWSVT